MRYVGQNFELGVAVDHVEGAERALHLPDVARMKKLFFEAHERSYGFHNPDDPVEVVNFRLTARGRLRKPDEAPTGEVSEGGNPTPVGRRLVYFDADNAADTPLYDRAALRAGDAITGPAIISQLDTTTVVHPGDLATVDIQLNLMIEITP